MSWVIIAILLVVFVIFVAWLRLGPLIVSLTGAGEKYYYARAIPDFCNNARDEYKNCEPRNLNVIEVAREGDDSFDALVREALYVENIPRRNGGDEIIHELTTNRGSVAEIVGFYNIDKVYDKDCSENKNCGLSVGTYVPEKELSRVFVNTALSGKVREGVMYWNRGSGRANMHRVVTTLSAAGVKWFILDAAGGERLRKLYESYGFKTLMNGYKKNIIDDEWFESTTYWMYGYADDIIAATAMNK